VTIRVGQVEEPLAPFGIARYRVWMVAGRDHARMEGVNVGMVDAGGLEATRDYREGARAESLGKIAKALAAAGVTFLPDDGKGGPGIRGKTKGR
jgi:hypothetical protein